MEADRRTRPAPWQDSPMDRDDTVLNSKDVAEMLDMSPDTVNEYARKSILPAFKRGRQWRFRRRDITAFKRQLRGDTAA
jgi:excisionase family DNA binding protein